MDIMLDKPIKDGFFINQAIGVKVKALTKSGVMTIIEPTPVTEVLGFIPYSHLNTDIRELYENKKLYVRCIDHNGLCLILAED